MDQVEVIRRAFRVTGRVQGVGYRWFVLNQAERLGLRGWVRNASDGSVELEAEGSQAAMDELHDALQKGPPSARVQQVFILAASSMELPGSFEVVR